MESITSDDLILVNNLSSRSYTGNRLLSNATDIEKSHLEKVTNKLRVIAEYYSQKYNHLYGPFEISVTTGNPIAIGGTTFKRVWSGIFKGALNKQYAAQISFVINPQEPCLDVGFYFGRAAGHSIKHDQRIDLERQLNRLGLAVSDAIINDSTLKARYESLFDFGFTAYSNGSAVLPDDWYNIIRKKTKISQIVAKVHPNGFGVIENSTIDLFVSQVIFLMAVIKDDIDSIRSIVITPLTPEQRAKQAERLALIGQKGEIFVMEYERSKLTNLGFKNNIYPKHIALESMHYGYDILSLDENGEEIYIEVKSTTRIREDSQSRKFFISTNEYNTFLNNKEQYKLYRVYDVENEPNIEFIDLETVKITPDGYIAEF